MTPLEVILIADRTVRVSLVAQAAGYIAGIEQAAKKTRDLGSEAEKLAQKRQGFEVVGRAALGVGAAMAAGVAIAVKAATDFDQAMSFVQAATHESAANMDLLRGAALQAGKDTVFSATEAANAIEELSKAGVGTADILGGALDGALDLAAAGGLGVARAAEIAATTLGQFGLKGGQASHVADVLAAGAGKAMGSVDDLAQGMKFVGPVAASMGVSLEETAGTMALFAQQGILGEQAGTSLRGVLASLTAPSSQARKEIDRLGITLYDSQGNFLGLENAAGELAKTYRTMDGASRDASLGIIFGRETVTAATALYRAGAEGVDKWTKAVDDSGYASETAAIRLDNLAGDFEQLSGSIETAFIQAGSGANDVLRFLTQSATEAVNAFGAMPAPVQTASVGVGAVAAATTLAAGAFFTAVPKVAEFRDALETMGPSAQRAGRALVGVSKAAGLLAGLGAAVILADKLANSSDAAAAGINETTKALKSMADIDDLFGGGIGGDVTDFATGLQLLIGDDVNSNMERFGSTLNGIFFGGQLGDQVKNTRERFDGLGDALAQMVNSGNITGASAAFSKMATAARDQGYSTADLIELMPSYREALAGVGQETDGAAGATEDNADALVTMSGAAQDAEIDISDLADTIRGFGSAQLDVNAATRDYEAAIDDLTDSIDKNGTTLDRTTEAGRANDQALDNLAKSTLDLSAATLEQTNSQEDANGVIANGRQKLIEMLGQFGITGQAAETYADKLGLIPGQVHTAATISIDWAAVNAYVTALNNIPGRRDTIINQVWQETGAPRGQVGAAYNGRAQANGSILSFYANGGMENHVAQIAPAGAWRVWAEPETGGEAYIPLAESKRARSIDILAATADRFGYSLAKFANGGLVQYAPGGPGGGGGVTYVTNENHFHMPPVPTTDPMAASTVIGREFGRQVAAR